MIGLVVVGVALQIITIMFRNMGLAVCKGPQRHAARRLASLRLPTPLIAWREELQEMAVGLRSANPLAPTAARVNREEVFLTISISRNPLHSPGQRGMTLCDLFAKGGIEFSPLTKGR